MLADTSFSLTAQYQSVLGKGATCAITNLSIAGQSVIVTLSPQNGIDQVVYLRASGDSLAVSTDVYRSVIVAADSYPCPVAFAVLAGPPPIVTAMGSAVAQGTTAGTIKFDRVTVGNSIGVQLTSLPGAKSILIKADSGNTATVRLHAGNTAVVFQTDWPLIAGEVFRADVSAPIYAIAEGGTQYLYTMQGA